MSEGSELNDDTDQLAGQATDVVDAPVERIIDLRDAPESAPPRVTHGPGGKSVSLLNKFAPVLIIYVLAICASIVTVLLMKSPLWLEVLVADVVATVVTFIGSFLVRNTSMYDAYWSVAPAVAAIGMAATGMGSTLRHLLLTVVVLAWAVRLTANWAYGWPGMHHEDWRYVKMQQDTGKAYWMVSFFGLHFFPTVLVYAGMFPMFVAYRSARSFGLLDVLGIIVGLAAVALEGVADLQMMRFRRRNPAGDEVMDQGLWGLSRHPNYLGEICFWVSVALFGLGAAPSQWWRLIGVLGMIALFFGASIPMIEKRHLERKGDAFIAYRRRVPMLVPGLKGWK